MADTDRIVFPDEVADIKAAAADAKANVGGETNTIDAAPEETTDAGQPEVSVSSRNVVQVPTNCPAGYQMGSDGVCREVF